MALARRSVLSVFPRLHPSSLLLLLHRDDFANSSLSDHHHSQLDSSVAPHLQRKDLECPLPFGAQFALRRFSSSAHGSQQADYMKEMTDAFSEKGGDVAELIVEKGVDSVHSVGPALGEVAAAAADSAFPVAALQHAIDAVHSFTGFNWWASIMLTTVIIRSATIPLLIHQLKATTKLSLLRPELEVLKEQMQNSMDPQVLQENQRQMKELFKKHGITPFAPLKGIFIQGPIFISFYLAITNMVQKVPSFKEGGAFWFTDLTTPDPFYLLPILTGSAFLLTVELNMQEGLEGNPVAGTMKKFSRFFAFLSVPITASFPKAIFCYWITSNLFSLTYGLAIKRPQVRKYLNLPQMPSPAQPAQKSFSFFGAQTESNSAPSPTSTDQPQPSEKKVSSSAVISQRIRNLERRVKARTKQKK